MNKLITGLLAALLGASMAAAQTLPPPPSLPPSLAPVADGLGKLSLSLGGTYSIGISTTPTSLYGEVDRNIMPDGQWGIGYGYELFPISKLNPDSGITYQLAYIGIANTWVVGDTRGLFIVNLGVKLPTLVAKGIQEIDGAGDLIQSWPAWAKKLNLASSVDVGYGNRLFGVPSSLAAQNIKKANLTVGVHVNVLTIGSFYAVPGSL